MLFLSVEFNLNCSVDETGLITIDCQEVDGEIDSEQLYCIYDSGPRESCMATITYSLHYSSKNSAPLIFLIRTPITKFWKIIYNFWQRSSHIYAINGNTIHTRQEC